METRINKESRDRENGKENRRKDDETVQVIAERINTLHEDVGELKASLRESMSSMSEAITKLVLLEQKNTYIAESIERVLKVSEKAHERIDVQENKMLTKIESLENRIDELEKTMPETKRVINWIYAGIGIVLTGVLGVILKVTVGI